MNLAAMQQVFKSENMRGSVEFIAYTKESVELAREIAEKINPVVAGCESMKKLAFGTVVATDYDPLSCYLAGLYHGAMFALRAIDTAELERMAK